MTTYEFPPKVPPTEEFTSEKAPVSTGQRLMKLLQWSLYGVVALLVAGFLALQTNPGVANYLTAIPGLSAAGGKSCPMSACSQGRAEGCCAHQAAVCPTTCPAEQDTQELVQPPAPPMPEPLSGEGVTL